MTPVTHPVVFYTIHWNYYLHMLFETVPTNRFELVLSHWKKPYAFSLASNKLWLSKLLYISPDGCCMRFDINYSA